MSEHWFDRLTAKYTRRQGFKLAAAGALAVPLARAGSAAAVENCTQPCFYTAQVHSAKAVGTCQTRGGAAVVSYFTGIFVNPAAAAALGVKDVFAGQACYEQAALAQKAEQYDCLRAGCGGFVPDSDILCGSGCRQVGGKCCPFPSSTGLSKYVCCGNCAANGDGCMG